MQSIAEILFALLLEAMLLGVTELKNTAVKCFISWWQAPLLTNQNTTVIRVFSVCLDSAPALLGTNRFLRSWLKSKNSSFNSFVWTATWNWLMNLGHKERRNTSIVLEYSLYVSHRTTRSQTVSDRTLRRQQPPCYSYSSSCDLQKLFLLWCIIHPFLHVASFVAESEVMKLWYFKNNGSPQLNKRFSFSIHVQRLQIYSDLQKVNLPCQIQITDCCKI